MTEIDKASFWEWAYSDFLSNSLRGVLAEYIVATATGCAHRPRVQWDAVDLVTADGIRIEVKSASYLQAWEQPRPSDIRFDIAAKRSWDATTNTSATEAHRGADVYVFCIFATREKGQANPRDVAQWRFLACSSQFLTARFGRQKSVALSMLEKAGLQDFGYPELHERVRAALHPAGHPPAN